MEIIIDSKAQAKIDYWVANCKEEVSGMGTIQRDGDTIMVTEVFLLEQEVTGATTEITAKALGKLEFELVKAENEDNLNFWWHSHANMDVFWSGTDHAQMKEFASNGYIVASVFNKRGECRSAYRQGQSDFYPAIFADNLKTSHSFLLDEDECVALGKELKEKVTRKVHKPMEPWKNPYHSDARYKKPRQQELPLTNELPIDFDYRAEPNEFGKLLGMEQKAWRDLCTQWFASATDEEVEDFYDQYSEDIMVLSDVKAIMLGYTEAKEVI